jgi:hypothetical protein
MLWRYRPIAFFQVIEVTEIKSLIGIVFITAHSFAKSNRILIACSFFVPNSLSSLEENLKLGGRLGSVVHNTQILAEHADGHLVSNDEVADIYLRAFDWGEQAGCVPTFEVHINMWSEDFRRISEVADLVEARGVPFRMTALSD